MPLQKEHLGFKGNMRNFNRSSFLHDAAEGDSPSWLVREKFTFNYVDFLSFMQDY